MQLSPRVPLAISLLIILSLACVVITGDLTPTPAPTATFTSTPTQTPPAENPIASQAPLATSGIPIPTFAPPVAPAAVLHFYVSGMVWEDVCSNVDGPIPNPIPVGCVDDPFYGLISDGIYSTGEPGIAGVTVKIELNCNYSAFTVVTDINGFFQASFTVPADAGVSQQRVCVSVNATGSENSGILMPGEWAYPDDDPDVALYDVTIQVETQNTLNFGWDYELR